MKILSFFRRIFTPGNIVFVALAALLIFLFLNIFSIIMVSGTSMDPTLADGQFLVGLHVNVPFVEIARGDIVTACDPTTNKLLIKRIIALPGDRVELTGGQLYLNGVLQYEPYIYEPMNDIPSNTIAEFTVPDGQYFILGDNRNVSRDSRLFGCVETEQIETLIPLRHQAITAAAMAVCILLISRFADACATFVDLRWSAYAAAKKACESEEDPAETENEQEETCPKNDCNPDRDVL